MTASPEYLRVGTRRSRSRPRPDRPRRRGLGHAGRDRPDRYGGRPDGRTDRRHRRNRRVRVRAAGGAARRRYRRSRALGQGPAGGTGRGHRPRRRTVARGSARRCRRPRQADAGGAAQGRPGGHRVAPTGCPAACARLGPFHRARFVATSIPGLLTSARTSMRWCWPSPACVGWGASTRSPRSSTRRASSRPQRRERWPSNAARTTWPHARLLAAFDDAGARACITAERALLAALEAGCSAPIGALAEIRADPAELTLTAVVTAADGSDAVRRTLTGVVTDPAGVGRRLAADLIASGADKMMGSSS